MRVELVRFIEERGVCTTELPRKERWYRFQRWREIYSRRIHEKTGKWVHRGWDWHTFSGGFAIAMRGARAVELYKAGNCPEVLVLPQDSKFPALRCSRWNPIDFSPLGLEVSIAPDSLEWTMVFSHEQPECLTSLAQSGRTTRPHQVENPPRKG